MSCARHWNAIEMPTAIGGASAVTFWTMPAIWTASLKARISLSTPARDSAEARYRSERFSSISGPTSATHGRFMLPRTSGPAATLSPAELRGNAARGSVDGGVGRSDEAHPPALELVDPTGDLQRPGLHQVREGRRPLQEVHLGLDVRGDGGADLMSWILRRT